VPADVTVECDNVPAPASPNATDNCDGDPEIAFRETNMTRGCADNYTITRTWTATDACGNSASQTQVITVQDTTAPEIQGCPEDANITVCSNDSVVIPPAPTLTVTDNCDDVFTVEAECCFDGAGITRTWSATDACGNKAIDCVQQIAFNPACDG
jgi:hypothetical protein